VLVLAHVKELVAQNHAKYSLWVWRRISTLRASRVNRVTAKWFSAACSPLPVTLTIFRGIFTADCR
jgi:hypothetical protein